MKRGTAGAKPGLAVGVSPHTVFSTTACREGLQLTALFLKAALKLLTSCKNKCDLHLIWVITFTVN